MPSEGRQGNFHPLPSAGLFHVKGWELHLLKKKKEVKAGAMLAVIHAASYYTAHDSSCISTACKILIPLTFSRQRPSKTTRLAKPQL